MTIQPDKLGHYAAGTLIYAVGHFVSPVVGLALVALAAVGKEIYDWFHRDKHTPEIADAVATMLGGLVGFICGV